MVEWEAYGSVGSPESLKMFSFPNILYFFFGEVGSVGSPESLKLFRFPNIFLVFSVEWEAWGSPESLKMDGLWEAQIIENV